jgi:putative ATP-dependent endonuclease of OLD family
MYLERLQVDGFRNLEGDVVFDPSLTLLVGENNAGKSNVVDAIRLVVDVESGQYRPRLQASDFGHDGLGQTRRDELTISAVFADLDLREQGRMASALAPTLGPARARIGIRAALLPGDRIAVSRGGGDRIPAW